MATILITEKTIYLGVWLFSKADNTNRKLLRDCTVFIFFVLLYTFGNEIADNYRVVMTFEWKEKISNLFIFVLTSSKNYSIALSFYLRDIKLLLRLLLVYIKIVALLLFY